MICKQVEDDKARAAAGCQGGKQLDQQNKPDAQNAKDIQEVKLEILTCKAKIIRGFIDQGKTQSYARDQYER